MPTFLQSTVFIWNQETQFWCRNTGHEEPRRAIPLANRDEDDQTGDKDGTYLEFNLNQK